MTRRGVSPTAEPYSPQRRTALVLTGTGTAGVYHAGVLRALHEAGVKIDVVAGRGVGVIGALFAAVDGAQRLWDDKGVWSARTTASLYPWRTPLRVIGWALAVSVGIVLFPLAALAAGLIVFPIDFVLKMVGVGAASGLTAWYTGVLAAAFAPEGLPTWLPRFAVLVLGGAAVAAFAYAWSSADTRAARGPFWWRLVPPPLDALPIIDHCWHAVWDLVRGAAPVKPPPPAELGRRYTELLSDNLGQPGFRELLIVAHDVDAGRDLVFALVAEFRRRDLVRRTTSQDADVRRAEVVDLAGLGREHLADAVAAALTVPVASGLHTIRFSPDSYWRGEAHRLCDRTASLGRLLEELDGLGVEQAILVSAAPESPGPHTLRRSRLEGRARAGEYVQSTEAATVRDASVWMRRVDALRVFTIRPRHNPIGPFDFGAGYDDRSDRVIPLNELMTRGYEDAYHQFVEPIVGASGERVGL